MLEVTTNIKTPESCVAGLNPSLQHGSDMLTKQPFLN